jgi:hypothetical protein
VLLQRLQWNLPTRLHPRFETPMVSPQPSDYRSIHMRKQDVLFDLHVVYELLPSARIVARDQSYYTRHFTVASE